MHIIDDLNYGDYQQMGMIGGWPGCRPRSIPYGRMACAAPADDMDLVPEADWPAAVERMTEEKFWPQDMYEASGDHTATDFQDGLGYCTKYSLCQAVKINIIEAGGGYRDLAPESLGGSVGWRNDGNDLAAELDYVTRHGIGLREDCGQHDLTPSDWKPGWDRRALEYVPTEWWDIPHRSFAHVVTRLIRHRKPVWMGLAWWGHAVCVTKLVMHKGEVCAYTPNSHGPGNDAILAGTRKLPDLGCFSLRSCRFPRR